MYRKVYDENKGIFVYVDAWTGLYGVPQINGLGIFDTLTSLVSSSIAKNVAKNVAKKTLETVGKTALESGTKKIGTEVGNMAASKMINLVKGKPAKVQRPDGSKTLKPSGAYSKPVSNSVGNLIVKELSKLHPNEDVNIRINKLLSGSGSIRRNRINKLIKK